MCVLSTRWKRLLCFSETEHSSRNHDIHLKNSRLQTLASFKLALIIFLFLSFICETQLWMFMRLCGRCMMAKSQTLTQQEKNSPHVCLLFLYLDCSHHLFIVLHWGIIEVPCNPPADGVLQWQRKRPVLQLYSMKINTFLSLKPFVMCCDHVAVKCCCVFY